MMRRSFILLGAACVVGLAGFAGCFNPHTKDGGFLCAIATSDGGASFVPFKSLCPNGYTCNPEGVCVVPGETGDMTLEPFDLSGKQPDAATARTCDQRVQAGAFSGFTALTALNTAADESHIAYDTKGGRLLFVRSNQLFAAATTGTGASKIKPAAPTAVSVLGGPTTFNGGSFDATSGHYWFSGTTGGVTSLYDGAPGAGSFTATVHADPSSSCPFYDPVFEDGNPLRTMYFSYALAGCTGPSYIVAGGVDHTMTSIYSAYPESGWAYPTLTSTSLTMMFSSTGTAPTLYTAGRDDTTFEFGNPVALPLAGIGGAGMQDLELAISDDCTVAYFVSVRTGGAGGADIYAANIAAQ